MVNIVKYGLIWTKMEFWDQIRVDKTKLEQIIISLVINLELRQIIT